MHRALPRKIIIRAAETARAHEGKIPLLDAPVADDDALRFQALYERLRGDRRKPDGIELIGRDV